MIWDLRLEKAGQLVASELLKVSRPHCPAAGREGGQLGQVTQPLFPYCASKRQRATTSPGFHFPQWTSTGEGQMAGRPGTVSVSQTP